MSAQSVLTKQEAAWLAQTAHWAQALQVLQLPVPSHGLLGPPVDELTEELEVDEDDELLDTDDAEEDEEDTVAPPVPLELDAEDTVAPPLPLELEGEDVVVLPLDVALLLPPVPLTV